MLRRVPERARYVSQEPQNIDAALLGAPLASVARRGWALAIDMLLFGLLFGTLFVGLTAWSMHRQNPEFFGAASALLGGAREGTEDPAEVDRVTTEFYALVLDRCPGAFPAELAEAIRRGDADAVGKLNDGYVTTIGLGGGRTRFVPQGGGGGQATLVLGADLLLGPFASVIGWATCFLAWFALWTWRSRGRTPGKALFGVRVVRLDGRRVGLWDSFSRAAGYSASAATLMLGFLEAIWHPNRQALHDKIAGTVVIRSSRRRA